MAARAGKNLLQLLICNARHLEEAHAAKLCLEAAVSGWTGRPQRHGRGDTACRTASEVAATMSMSRVLLVVRRRLIVQS
jgi:hypothetical protein